MILHSQCSSQPEFQSPTALYNTILFYKINLARGSVQGVQEATIIIVPNASLPTSLFSPSTYSPNLVELCSQCSSQPIIINQLLITTPTSTKSTSSRPWLIQSITSSPIILKALGSQKIPILKVSSSHHPGVQAAQGPWIPRPIKSYRP